MCDLWDPQVEPEWRAQVFDAMAAAPQHRYALLTKQPQALSWYEFDAIEYMHAMIGVSVTGPGDRDRLTPMRSQPRMLLRYFVSFEPLLGQLAMDSRSIEGALRQQVDGHLLEPWCSWAIIGAETGGRRDRVIPQWAWVEEITDACDALGIPVFWKDNLKPYAPPGTPWRQEWPEVWA